MENPDDTPIHVSRYALKDFIGNPTPDCVTETAPKETTEASVLMIIVFAFFFYKLMIGALLLILCISEDIFSRIFPRIFSA